MAMTPPACAPQLRALPDSDMAEPELARLDHGYGLLDELLTNEAKVADILKIKGASEATKALLKDISATATKAAETIRERQSDAPPVNLTVTGLPLLETDARNRIANSQTAILLLAFGSFDFRILLTQQSACQYAWALASSLAAVDPNSARAEAMSKIAAEFDALEKRVLALLDTAPEVPTSE
ncbi:MAG: hypothetical protein JNK53_06600 [Phycisphaerae bacterium]|nr:hypothetical protein [Phycisphaerae bacterium]